MTDETRAELGGRLGLVVRAAMAGGETYPIDQPTYVSCERDGCPTVLCLYSAGVALDALYWAGRWAGDPPTPPDDSLPPLTTGQLLGLAAFLGGNDAAMALADYLIEQGTDWATAVYEKGRRDGSLPNLLAKAFQPAADALTEFARRMSAAGITAEQMRAALNPPPTPPPAPPPPPAAGPA